MDDITIHYHLAIPSFVSVGALLGICVYRNRLFSRRRWFWTGVTVFFLTYLFLVGGALYDDIYYQWDLNRYDLDKDGTFSVTEITPQQEIAMQRLTSDVGRNFALISGLKFAFLSGLMICVSGSLVSRIANMVRRR